MGADQSPVQVEEEVIHHPARSAIVELAHNEGGNDFDCYDVELAKYLYNYYQLYEEYPVTLTFEMEEGYQPPEITRAYLYFSEKWSDLIGRQSALRLEESGATHYEEFYIEKTGRIHV